MFELLFEQFKRGKNETTNSSLSEKGLFIEQVKNRSPFYYEGEGGVRLLESEIPTSFSPSSHRRLKWTAL